MKQARNLRVGDILLYKNEESRIITDTTHVGAAWTLHTTTLAGENPHFDTYNASRSGARRRHCSDADQIRPSMADHTRQQNHS